MTIHFLTTQNNDLLSGIVHYNEKIAEYFILKGYNTKTYNITDSLTFPEEDQLLQLLVEAKKNLLKDIVIAEGEVMTSFPETIKKLAPLCKLIALVHIPQAFNPHNSVYTREIISKLETEILTYAHKVVTGNHYTADLLLNFFQLGSKLKVILPGIGPTPRKTQYPESPTKIICIANFSLSSDYTTIFRSLAALKQYNWNLDCYGDTSITTEHISELKSLVKRIGLINRIHFYNYNKSELSDLLINSDLMVNPISFDSIGMIVMEALSHGIPVITTTGTGHPQFLKSSTCQFFAPGNVYSLQCLFENLFEEPSFYKKLCHHSSQFHLQTLRWEHTINEFETIFEEL